MVAVLFTLPLIGAVTVGNALAVLGTIASFLLRPHPQTPTFKAMTSAWGQAWPKVYNLARVAGKVIQASDVTKRTNKAKKTSKFSQTLAVGFCEGPADVLRIWADQQVIYDSRPLTATPSWAANTQYASGDIVVPTSPGARQFVATTDGLSGAVEPTWNNTVNATTLDNEVVWNTQTVPKARKIGKQYNFTMRIYRGDETQLQDSALEELVGAGNQSAYRGLCHIVLESFDLSKYGNRVPNLEAEIDCPKDGAAELWVRQLTEPGPNGTSEYARIASEGGGFVNWTLDRLYQMSAFGREGAYDWFFETQASSGTLLRYQKSTDMLVVSGNTDLFPMSGSMDSDGNIYMVTYDGGAGPSYNGKLSKIDPTSLLETAACTPYSTSSGYDEYAVSAQSAYFEIAGHKYLCLSQSAYSGSPSPCEIIDLAGSMASLCHCNASSYSSDQVQGIAVGATTATTAEIWAMRCRDYFPSSGSEVTLVKYTFDANMNTLTRSDIVTLVPTDISATWTASPANPVWQVLLIGVAPDGNLIVNPYYQFGTGPAGTDPGSFITKLSKTDGSIIWNTELSDVQSMSPLQAYAKGYCKCDLSADSLVWPQPGKEEGEEEYGYSKINLSTGTFVTGTSETHLVGFHFQETDWQWNSALGKGIYYEKTNGTYDDFDPPTWTRGYVVWAPGSTRWTLEDINADIADRVGLSGKYDFSGLASVIPTGITLEDRMPARQFVEQIMPAYFYDLTDIGEQIVGTLRSNASVLLTIPEDDLAAADLPETFVDRLAIERNDDLEIPRDLSVSYKDYQHDYQAGSTPSTRLPITQHSSGRNAVLVPCVLTPSEASNIAERLLYLAWKERDTFKLSVSLEYFRITPADVIDVVRDSQNHRVRVTKVTLTPDQIIEIEGCSEDFGTYTLTVPPDIADQTSGAFVPGELNPIITPVLAVLDTAALRQDDLQNPGVYVAGSSSELDGGWDEEAVQESTDNSIWDTKVTLTSESILGTVDTVLANCVHYGLWDRVNTVRVTLFFGQMASASEADLVANFTNLLWMSNGEIIQFATATLVSAGVWDLTDLLRGRFGTEAFTGTHAASETFAMPDQAAMLTVDYSPSELDATRYWRGQNDADSAPTTPVQTLTMTTRRLMPYAPYYIKGARDGSNNLTITGMRRMRWSGAPLWTPPETDSPVAIEADIYNGASVVRTITSTASAGGSVVTDASAFSVYYSAADQTTDFGSPQASVVVKVYQMNAVRGRGYPGSATV